MLETKVVTLLHFQLGKKGKRLPLKKHYGNTTNTSVLLINHTGLTRYRQYRLGLKAYHPMILIHRKHIRKTVNANDSQFALAA